MILIKKILRAVGFVALVATGTLLGHAALAFGLALKPGVHIALFRPEVLIAITVQSLAIGAFVEVFPPYFRYFWACVAAGVMHGLAVHNGYESTPALAISAATVFISAVLMLFGQFVLLPLVQRVENRRDCRHDAQIGS